MTTDEQAVSVGVVHELEPDQVNRLCGILEEFWDNSGFEGVFRPGTFLTVMRHSLIEGSGIVIVWERDGKIGAAIGGGVLPCPFTLETIAMEQFFYATPEARGHALTLLSQFERAAEKRGAKRILMVHLHNEFGDRIAKWYERRGYKLLESTYQKVL